MYRKFAMAYLTIVQTTKTAGSYDYENDDELYQTLIMRCKKRSTNRISQNP